ncbi:hypothetical protein O1L60_42835 [Streptomyces diastatochromogenes]|nr:hypothetical protein [Streptomyces diastatochromogenes]
MHTDRAPHRPKESQARLPGRLASGRALLALSALSALSARDALPAAAVSPRR